jgi:hypothetical protein
MVKALYLSNKSKLNLFAINELDFYKLMLSFHNLLVLCLQYLILTIIVMNLLSIYIKLSIAEINELSFIEVSQYLRMTCYLR